MRNIGIISLSILLLSACASTSKKVDVSAFERVTVPTIGKEAVAYLGERMILAGLGYFTDSINIPGFDAYATDFRADTYYRIPGTDTFKAYNESVTNNNGYGNPLNTQDWVTYDPEKNEVCVGLMTCYSATEMGAVYSPEKVFYAQANSFQQLIEYNGKSGSTLKFTYREFKDGMARGSFTTDFTIDLNDGSTFGYKGARFEVIDANNSQIKYKILKAF